MDTLAHALYGVTFFSRMGLAGCLTNKLYGSVKRWHVDWTVFAAAGFAVLPDLASIGIYFLNLIVVIIALGMFLAPSARATNTVMAGDAGTPIYLLNDSFLVPRAAKSVDGTFPEPPSGLRNQELLFQFFIMAS